MITSINDKIRDYLLSSNCLDVILVKLEQNNIKDKEEIIKLLLSDYYKIKYFLSISKNNFNIDKPIDILIDDFIYNEGFLCEVVENATKFNSLYDVSKIIIMEDIEQNEKQKLFLNISNSFILDNMCYRFDYNLNSFKELYKDYKEKTKDQKKITDVSFFIANKLLKYKNKEQYNKFILEFVSIYYKWSIYVKDNLDKNFLYNEDYLYLEMIKQYSPEQLLKNSELDYIFLVNMIENYLFYSTIFKDVSEEIVNEYFTNKVEEEVQKKLKRD